MGEDEAPHSARPKVRLSCWVTVASNQEASRGGAPEEGKQPKTQTVTLREPMGHYRSHPFTKCHRLSQRYLFLMCTNSLNYLNGQNKTATYLWPFISVLSQKHIFFSPSPILCPKYMKSLSFTQQ